MTRDKNGVSSSRHKIVWELAYLGVKMTSLVQKHKVDMNDAYIGVRKLRKSKISQERKCCI